LWLIAGLLLALVLGLSAGPLIGQMWPLFSALWHNWSEANMQAYVQAMFSPPTMAFMGLGYAGNLSVLLGVALMGYGVNARAVLAALAEGKLAASAS
jgi:hypothetical protein